MTTERDRDCGVETVRGQAAHWFARCNDGDLAREERQAFERWLAQHPSHAEEFQLLQQLWGAAELIPRERLRALADEPPTRRPATGSWIRYAVAAVLVLAVAGSALFYTFTGPASYDASFATVLGERRQITLPDGSQIELNGRTRLSAHYQRAQRHIILEEGEAMFSVQHDASRPFVVRTDRGAVTVTGTRFDVRRDSTRTQVAVEAGTVLLRGPQGERGDTVTLTAGLGSYVDADGRVAPARPVTVSDFTAWRGGKLVFDDMPLADVVREVSRYRERPLRLANVKVGQLRLTSVFRTDDTDALLRTLPSILPVSVRTLSDGSQEIFSR